MLVPELQSGDVDVSMAAERTGAFSALKLGTLPQRLRLYSGLVLFAYALTHFLNHALGLISIDVMEDVQAWRRAAWRSLPGTVLLYGSFAVHVVFALVKLLGRRTFRMEGWEGVQLALGLLIPYQLVQHVMATRMMHQVFGIDDTYVHELAILWPSEVVGQTVLLLLVWVHSVVGLHYWLRIERWYQRLFLPLFALAVLIPVLATVGWIVAAQQVALFFETEGFTQEQFVFLVEAIGNAITTLTILGAVLAVAVFAPRIFDRLRGRITVRYPGDRKFKVAPGPTLLEISRILGVPHAAVCGGRARCSTCRVAIIEGGGDLAPPDTSEQAVLQRVRADEGTRLACQIRPQSDITIQPLVPAREAALAPDRVRDAYHWGIERPVALMFADMRNFTGLAEQKLPFDVVFVLNRYLGQMAEAIERHDGYVDKFIGDGIMAIFGISEGAKTGSRNALNAALAMAEALDALNTELSVSLEAPMRIGVGIHTGPAILGRIGVAAGDRETGMQGITALGDTVNAASRLESATKQFAAFLVVSDSTLRSAGVTLDGVPSQEISVKGKNDTIAVRVLNDLGPLREALRTPAETAQAPATVEAGAAS